MCALHVCVLCLRTFVGKKNEVIQTRFQEQDTLVGALSPVPGCVAGDLTLFL